MTAFVLYGGRHPSTKREFMVAIDQELTEEEGFDVTAFFGPGVEDIEEIGEIEVKGEAEGSLPEYWTFD